MGLAIVYGVVKQTGGWISAHSELGRGSTFELYFPQADSTEVGENPSHDTKAASEAPERGDETILVVEDQDGIRELVREFLQGCGYKVLDAADGSAALKMANDCKSQIDLLLTDVVMPNVGGRELAQRLAQVRPGMKVLFMSGYPDYSASGNDHLEDTAIVLQKPFSLESLARAIRSQFDA